MNALIITDTSAGHAASVGLFAAYFNPIACVDFRLVNQALRKLTPLASSAPDLVVLDIMSSPTKCLAIVARLRAVFPRARILVQRQLKPMNFDYLAELVGAHCIADIRNADVSGVKVMLDAVLSGNITKR